MFFSTRRIPTKWIVIILTIVGILISGYYWGQSQLNYHFTGSRDIPQINSELKKMVDHALLNTYATGKAGTLNDIKDVINLTNRIVADRLVYDYNVNCFDPNVAWEKRKVNCSGYAVLQVGILNYIFMKYEVGFWAEWHAGKVFWGNKALVGLAPYFPAAYKGWKGEHCYPVIYHSTGDDIDVKLYPDACFYDLFDDGWLVEREVR